MLKRKIIIFLITINCLFFIFYIKKNYLHQEKSDLDVVISNETEAVALKHRHYPYDVHPNFENVAPWLRAMDSSVVIADFDNNGFQDVFLTSAKLGTENNLFLNEKGVLANKSQEWGVIGQNKLNSTVGALAFDCNNDGFKDLFIQSDVSKMYINNGKNFSFNQQIETKDLMANKGNVLIYAANVLDYNQDGYLDLVLASYFESSLFQPTSFNIMPENFSAARNNAFLGVFLNDGKCQFAYKEIPELKKTHGWHLDIGVADLNDDMKTDLWIGSDYGQDHIFLRDEKSGYKQLSQSKLKQGEFSRNGMNTDFTYRPDGLLYAYSSQISYPGQKISGNVLWQIDKDFNFNEIASPYGVSECGWAWGGKFFDVNNDGLDDLLVADGFINGNKDKEYLYKLNLLDAASSTLIRDSRKWPMVEDSSLSGYQSPCLFMAKGLDSFVNYAPETTLKNEDKPGRGIAYVDLDNSGNMSFVISNNSGNAQFFKVKNKNENHWIGLELEGRKSNRDALGAKIVVHLNDNGILKKEHQPQNGFASQSDSRIHFGLGKKTVNKIEILWPSGVRQTKLMADLRLNSYNKIIEE